jgi:hypothetical protein
MNYPAQYYALIISNHGHALGGVAYDESSSYDYQTPKEIQQALMSTGKIDVLSMSACLLGNLEFAYEIRGLVDYYVASESVSWLPRSHNMYISGIKETTLPEGLALNMAASYYSEFDRYYTPSTISVVKMSDVNNVAIKTNTFAETIRKHWLDLGLSIWALTDAKYLQHFEENGDFVIDNDDRLVDLYHFAQLVSGLSEPELVNAAKELMTALDEYVLFNQHWSGTINYKGHIETWNHDNAHGVSIALPRSPISFYDSDWLDFAGDANWNQSSTQTPDLYQAVTSYGWSAFLIDLIDKFNPDAPDTPDPPDPVSPLVSIRIYLPLLSSSQ